MFGERGPSWIRKAQENCETAAHQANRCIKMLLVILVLPVSCTSDNSPLIVRLAPRGSDEAGRISKLLSIQQASVCPRLSVRLSQLYSKLIQS